MIYILNILTKYELACIYIYVYIYMVNNIIATKTEITTANPFSFYIYFN